MKFKELEFNETEIIQSLKDAGIEVFTPDDAEFNEHSTLREQLDCVQARQNIIDELFMVATELDAREFSSNCVIPELQALSWVELCDKGITLLQKIKNGWQEIR